MFFFIELERRSDTSNVLDRLIFTVLLLLLLLLLFVFIHNSLRIATIQSMPTYVIMLEPKQENLNKYLKRLTVLIGFIFQLLVLLLMCFFLSQAYTLTHPPKKENNYSKYAEYTFRNGRPYIDHRLIVIRD